MDVNLAQTDADVATAILKEKFLVVTVAVHENTHIVTPLQSHPAIIIVKKIQQPTSMNDQYQIIGFFTSHEGSKIGSPYVQGKANVFIAPTQIQGNKQPQFATPVIPPQNIKVDQFEISLEGTEYINEPSILLIIRDINSQVSSYIPNLYNSKGITIEHLESLYDFHVNIEKNELNTLSNIESNSTHETQDT